MNKKLKVVFVENYCVTWAELLTPAAEISEQISLAGTEASGTSNMKFMINGAVTLGTLDGANVEIHEAVGDDNILLFGMTASQVEELKRTGYNPALQYQNDPVIHAAMNELNNGIGGQQFRDIFQALTTKDQYMALADLGSYRAAQQKAQDLYRDQGRWNRMSLVNIARPAASPRTGPSGTTPGTSGTPPGTAPEEPHLERGQVTSQGGAPAPPFDEPGAFSPRPFPAGREMFHVQFQKPEIPRPHRRRGPRHGRSTSASPSPGT